MGRRWIYSRWFALGVGLVAGAVVGLAVYWGSRLHGPGLYTLCGTMAGGIAALVFYGYARSARLTELKVSIPHLTDLTFAVTSSNEGVAWRLFVESTTRVSAQPLADGTGVIREALNSLYALFQSVRTILLEARPTARAGGVQTVEHLAIGMLNVQMRPFMSKWHSLLLEWEKANPGLPESQWPQNKQCREELERMRLGMLEYIRGLGQLAGVQNVDAMLGGEATT
ncbi:hypothetical protein ACIBPB_06785 [Micromonospora sp. NPDC049836]|uniref:hypothetical protein n=1 Tax=Micromonospora sp. NPDC049836 TaxID=3364274 RepID=UPI00378F1E6A